VISTSDVYDEHAGGAATCGSGEIEVPVGFGGCSFTPGAMLYADDDGIVVLAP
jgi:regulator of ribonuclease activity A